MRTPAVLTHHQHANRITNRRAAVRRPGAWGSTVGEAGGSTNPISRETAHGATALPRAEGATPTHTALGRRVHQAQAAQLENGIPVYQY